MLLLIWLGHLVTTHLCALEELLLILGLVEAPVQELPAPPPRPDPANEHIRRQHLQQANEELRLTPVLVVASTGRQHSPSSRQNEAENGADEGPCTL